MICLLQRVTQGHVRVDDQVVGEIGPGLVVLVGFEPQDTTQTLQKMAHKLLHYRVFADDNGKMNLNIQQAFSGQGGELLLVPQFTLSASTRQGLRPSFQTSAPPDQARALFEGFCRHLAETACPPQTGSFGANMQVSLTNDGPVTFWLQI